jgi:hypothetical protein
MVGSTDGMVSSGPQCRSIRGGPKHEGGLPRGRRGAARQRSVAVKYGAQRTVRTAARHPYPLEWGPPCRLWHARDQRLGSVGVL